MQSVHALRWHQPLDYFQPSGGDTDSAEIVIARKYQQARKLALDYDYDALAIIESDMIVPPDTLERLASIDTDIAYGLYAFRAGKHEWSAMLRLDLKRFKSISDEPAQARAAWGQVIEVVGVGHGCTLIHRRVLECFAIRSRPAMFPDHLMAIDARYYGFRQHCDLGCVCGHIDRGGSVVWPDPEKDGLHRIEAA